jgi:hypothetical protein
MRDLCHVQSARAAGEVARVCAELVHGYNRHPAWDGDACCGGKDTCKPGPCVEYDEALETFGRMRMKLDGCLTGSRLAKDRAAKALTQVMIPEALDYPM